MRILFKRNVLIETLDNDVVLVNGLSFLSSSKFAAVVLSAFGYALIFELRRSS